MLSRVIVALGPYARRTISPALSVAAPRRTSFGPFESRLEIEALALTLLVVGGDALGRLGGDVLDPVGVLDDLRVA